MSCATCEHCDRTEAVQHRGHTLAGLCTRSGCWFNGMFVPTWLTGCPEHKPIVVPQADGDSGERWELQ